MGGHARHMENFWTEMKDIALSPGGLIVLGFFAFASITGLIAWLRGDEVKDRFILWQVVDAVSRLFK